MAFPAGYTEKTLADFMHAKLGDMAGVLGLTVGESDAGSYAEVVYDALLAYGTDDISGIEGLENIRKLRALAKVAVWQFAADVLSTRYDFSADGGKYSRSQMQKMAKDALSLAITDALVYDDSYAVTVHSVDDIHNPYKYVDEEDRAL